MGKIAKKIALAITLPILVLFIIFVVNQTMLVVAFAERIHPMAGNIVLGILLAVYAACLLIPVYLLITMRSPRTPPESEADPEYPRFLNDMAKKMSRNRAIGRQVVASREDIGEALKVLDRNTDDIIKKAASRIFLSTAISQNGKLDGIIVLAAQSKLIFDIARIYYQRPTVRNLIHLYANVATMVFLAVEIEDVDLAEIIQPVLTGILGSAAGAIPGFQVASMILVTSVLSGSSNAFLTLRVGAIAKQYCRCLTEPSRRTIRRNATIEATKMLGSIVAEGTRKVYGALWSSSQSKMENIFTGMGERIRNACTAISDRFKPGSTNK
jgi:hypothetical protein